MAVAAPSSVNASGVRAVSAALVLSTFIVLTTQAAPAGASSRARAIERARHCRGAGALDPAAERAAAIHRQHDEDLAVLLHGAAPIRTIRRRRVSRVEQHAVGVMRPTSTWRMACRSFRHRARGPLCSRSSSWVRWARWPYAWRARRSAECALAVTCVIAALAGFWSVLRIHGKIGDYQVFWLSLIGLSAWRRSSRLERTPSALPLGLQWLRSRQWDGKIAGAAGALM